MGLISGIKKAVKSASKSLSKAPAAKKTSTTVKKATSTAQKTVSNTAKSVNQSVNTVKNTVSKTSNNIKNTVKATDKAVDKAVSNTVNTIKTTQAQTAKTISGNTNAVKSDISSVVKTVSGGTQNTVKLAETKASNIINNLKGTSNTVKATAGTAIAGTAVYIGTAGTKAGTEAAAASKKVSNKIDDIITARDNSYMKAGEQIGSGEVAAGGSRLLTTTAADVVLPLDLTNVVNKTLSGNSQALKGSDYLWAGVDAIALIPTPITMIGGRALKTLKETKALKAVDAVATTSKVIGATGTATKALTTTGTTTGIIKIGSNLEAVKAAEAAKTASNTGTILKLSDAGPIKTASFIPVGATAAKAAESTTLFKAAESTELFKATEAAPTLKAAELTPATVKTLDSTESFKALEATPTSIKAVTTAGTTAKTGSTSLNYLKYGAVGLAGAGLYSFLTGSNNKTPEEAAKENALYNGEEPPTEAGIIPSLDEIEQAFNDPIPAIYDELQALWDAYNAGEITQDEYNQALDDLLKELAEEYQAGNITAEEYGDYAEAIEELRDGNPGALEELEPSITERTFQYLPYLAAAGLLYFLLFPKQARKLNNKVKAEVKKVKRSLK